MGLKKKHHVVETHSRVSCHQTGGSVVSTINLETATEQLKDDEIYVIQALDQNGNNLQWASERLRDNKKVVKRATRELGLNLQYASARLRADREFIIEVTSHRPEAVYFASDDILDDKEFLMSNIDINQYPKVLYYVSERLRDDKEVVLLAVKENKDLFELYALGHLEMVNGQALQFASERLKNDREIVLEAVKTLGFRYASEDLQRDGEIEWLNTKAEDERSYILSERYANGPTYFRESVYRNY